MRLEVFMRDMTRDTQTEMAAYGLHSLLGNASALYISILCLSIAVMVDT